MNATYVEFIIKWLSQNDTNESLIKDIVTEFKKN